MKSRVGLELADIFAGYGRKRLGEVSADKLRVFFAITACRTPALNGHVYECNNCKYKEQSYNSCRNRHCPKCQGSKAAKWVDARSSELLEVPYYHSVFTLPQELRGICYQNKRVVYGLLFRAVSETLKGVSNNPRFLGAKIGFFSLLHTWNQKLEYHPHIHVVSPKGGISKDEKKWIASPHKFFLPVRALSKVYRGKLLALLREAHKEGKLSFYGKLTKLKNRNEFEKLLHKSCKHPWTVYTKKPFGGPSQVLKYLSAYVHRTAISNYRLRALKDEKVTFAYRDRANKNKKRLLTLPSRTFINRFFLHILPRSFTRIRHYGFLGSASKERSLPLARKLIEKTSRESTVLVLAQSETTTVTVTPFEPNCPSCKKGVLIPKHTLDLSITHSYFATKEPRALSPPCFSHPVTV